MRFGGIWSFIVGAQVACTLLFVPAAVGIFTNSLHVQSRLVRVSDGALPHLPSRAWITRRWPASMVCLMTGRLARVARVAYEELAIRLREEPGVTHVTYGDRLPTTFPEWVAMEMEQDGAPPARLLGNFEGGFAMAAAGAGYHEAFGARIGAGRGLHAADAGAPNRPVVVNEAFMRVVGRNPVGARIRTRPGAASASRDPGTRLSAWSPICGRSRPIGAERCTSIPPPP